MPKAHPPAPTRRVGLTAPESASAYSADLLT